MQLTCALVDDEPLALSLLENYVQKTPFLQHKASYPNAILAMQGLAKQPVDLLFLDIQMPELSGLEFSKMVPASTRIVFTTAFSQYAVDSYRVEALDYLLKPISYADFLQAAHKAQQWFSLHTQVNPQPNIPTFIYVKSGRKLLQIELAKILYAEAQKDYVQIVCENSTEPIVALMTFKALEEALPAEQFIRVHRSFLVQKSKIKEIENNRIVFGKTRIPISDMYKNAFQEFLNGN